jgi:predicted chitinase
MSDFVVSADQFEAIFPEKDPFYTYDGLVEASSRYPDFASAGGDVVALQEAAAFLANVTHETGGLSKINEEDESRYADYCDASQPYGCPAGEAAYHGRGPLQLSWNFNYKAAGDELGIDLLNEPDLVATDPAVAWSAALWFWMTSTGAGSMTAHDAMVNGAGFAQTVRTINGELECDGRNPEQVASRVNAYQRITEILGVPTGDDLYC